jgi:AraC-like DNA-binding protein
MVASHWHDFYELVYVLSGTVWHLSDGHRELLEPGAAVLLTPTDIHGYASAGEEVMTCFNLAVEPTLVEEALRGHAVARHPIGARTVREPADMAGWLARAWQEQCRPRPGGAHLVEALTMAALVELARAFPVQATPTGTSLDLTRAVDFVDQNFREPIRMADAAARAGLSPGYFSERFHATVGETFQGYLQRRRLHFARSLLVATDATVTQVARAAGFGDLTHFTRAYRARFGVVPSRDRDPHRGRLGPSP